MNRFVIMTFAAALTSACALQAQAPAGGYAADLKQAYKQVENNLLKAADKMPDAGYDYKATPELRSFAAQLAHVAEAQMRTCAAAKGEQKAADVAGKTSKADISAALKASFDYCDSVYDGLTDENAKDMVQTFRGQRTKLSALYGNVVHDNEMYGVISVYLRLNKVVPPSSDRAPR